MEEIKEVEVGKNISLFSEISKLGHEQLVFCHDESTGLKALIGIHNTVLGPALGGTRMWNYATEEEAITDVLRLSRGMTFKNAITGLNIGCGKAVIIGDPKKLKSEALLRRFGKFVESLNGKYVTAEDVSMNERDMQYIAMETQYVTGLPPNMGGLGDPSPVTAYGTYMGIKGCAKQVYGSDSLEGKSVAVQGCGHVGTYLIEYLAKENAKVYVSDISESRVKNAVDKYKAIPVNMDEIYDLDVDVYAPCALGATLNDDTIPRLKCKIVAGAANNQLKEEIEHGKMLVEKGITYAPDFLINAGGVINVYMEFIGMTDAEMPYKQAEKIYDTTQDILKKSEREGITTQEAAMKLAIKRIEDIGKTKLPI